MLTAFSTPVLLIGTAFVAVVFLALRALKELGSYIDELQFFLRQRTISDNKSKARLAVAQSQFEKMNLEKKEMQKRIKHLEEEARVLRLHLNQVNEDTELLQQRLQTKESLPAQVVQLSEEVSHLEKLELEVSSIQKLLTNDIKTQLSNYMQQVDGISEKIKTAREQSQSSQMS